LAAKLPPGKAPIAQLVPKLALCPGQAQPQSACSKDTYLFHAPSPQPSPPGGEGEVRASISDA
jgi:hypothetical protein